MSGSVAQVIGLVTGRAHGQPKTVIGQREVWYLGYHLGGGQVRPQVEMIRGYPSLSAA